MNIYNAILNAPEFSIGIQCSDTHMLKIAFLEPTDAYSGNTPFAQHAAQKIQAYLADPNYQFDLLNLPLASAGTPFQQKVWQAINTIPNNQRRTYGEIARFLKTAPRAVGQACGANPYPIITPCHRVVAANGTLGGFANARGGFLLAVKRWLLHHEQYEVAF